MSCAPISGKMATPMTFLRWLFPPGEKTHAISRVLFLRGLGVIFLIAILSWWVQIDELVGSRGLTPMADYLDQVGKILDQQERGRFTTLPTLFWISSSDGFIHLACLTGTMLAVMLVAGFAPGPCLLGLWAIYLSLLTTGGAFMSFQWDILLVEAGFLAIWLAPWRRWQIPISRADAPPLGWGEKAMLWLSWFVIAKLMFQSGWVKLAWASPENPEWWPDHTAMTFHYFTQPIPNPLAWWAHQLPTWFQKFSLVPMYAVELGFPFLVFLGARLRLIAALGFTGLMLAIAATGNYTYFNWLTIVLCLPLVSDRYYLRVAALVRKWWSKARKVDSTGSSPRPNPVNLSGISERQSWIGLGWRAPAILLLGFLNLHVCLGDWHEVSGRVANPALPWTHLAVDLTPEWTDDLRSTLSPFHLASGYGLFRTMTTERLEIVFEGSRDGVEWKEYGMRWKPGRLDEMPPLVAPHQPRLAWQMWFAALEPGYHPRGNSAGWMSAVVRGLLTGDDATLSFFDEDPFVVSPPRYVRGVLYRYEFTTPEERRETGNWWKRDRVGLWLPPVGN